MPNKVIADFLEDEKEIEDLLDTAETNASSSWEMNFMDDVRRQWERWGMQMFLSEAQYESIARIARKHIK